MPNPQRGHTQFKIFEFLSFIMEMKNVTLFVLITAFKNYQNGMHNEILLDKRIDFLKEF